MWGAPSSGKTTFLAALSLALNRRGGDWNLAGANEASEKILIRLTAALTRGHAFPDATEAIEQYNWVLNGQVRPGKVRRFRRDKEQIVKPVRVSLDLVDASGEITDPEQLGFSVRHDLIEHLAHCGGIVYMFDPIREFDKGDAFDHTFGMIVQLARRLAEEPGFDGRLPHYVAVCVTKFDEIKVFETARKLDLLMADPNDPYGFPRVDDRDARELFQKLCEVSGSGNAEMVLNALEQYFRTDRIKYFVTSAVGFYVDPRARMYDPDDPQNLLPDEKAPRKARIRGPVHPINVVEPLLWLSTKLSEQMGTGNETRP
jgi:hypothetical protein